jgi:DNA-binding transcriptional ArsR family regulator
LPKAAVLKSPQSADVSPVSTPDRTRKIIMPTRIPAIPREIREAAVLFDYLSNPMRLIILRLLAAEGEMFVGQICERLRITVPAVSPHLRLLRSSGLVESRRDGAKVVYSIIDGFEGLASRLQSVLDSIGPTPAT